VEEAGVITTPTDFLPFHKFFPGDNASATVITPVAAPSMAPTPTAAGAASRTPVTVAPLGVASVNPPGEFLVAQSMLWPHQLCGSLKLAKTTNLTTRKTEPLLPWRLRKIATIVAAAKAAVRIGTVDELTVTSYTTLVDVPRRTPSTTWVRPSQRLANEFHARNVRLFEISYAV
jgi:hypothetical protein